VTIPTEPALDRDATSEYWVDCLLLKYADRGAMSSNKTGCG
jgi:hypothetical protein